MSALAPRGRAFRLLDFGAGSGVLSIAGARLGAEVVAVEIDERSIDHARRNLRHNGVADRVTLARRLDEVPGRFDLVVANILRRVLLDTAPDLAARLAPGATLVLSGLVSTDVPEVTARYVNLLGGRRPQSFERGDWWALVWRV